MPPCPECNSESTEVCEGSHGMVLRCPVTLELLEDDYCISCGQRVRYLDIKESLVG